MKSLMIVVTAFMLFSLPMVLQADTFIDPDLDGSGCGDALRFKGYVKRAIDVCDYSMYDTVIIEAETKGCIASHLMDVNVTEIYVKEGSANFDKRHEGIGIAACLELITQSKRK
jgi:hypothetical protein